MSKYGDAAVQAVQLIKNGDGLSPTEAWRSATKKVFPLSQELQNKGCPKGAFLGLCCEGLIVGIPAGQYSKPSKNGEYAIGAIHILKSNRFLASEPDRLWKKVVGNTKSSNHQMDVVVGLWDAKCIST